MFDCYYRIMASFKENGAIMDDADWALLKSEIKAALDYAKSREKAHTTTPALHYAQL